MENIILKNAIQKEEIRNEKLIAEYLVLLSTLPKGKIILKKIKNNSYYYLAYRDGDKVVTQYVGKDEESTHVLQEQLIRRKQVENILKSLYDEKEKIMKIEALL